MGYNDHIDFELHDAIEDLLDEELIEEKTPAYGIAQKVIHEGYDSLSAKQRFIYDRDVVPALKKRSREIEIIQRINSWPE